MTMVVFLAALPQPAIEAVSKRLSNLLLPDCPPEI